MHSVVAPVKTELCIFEGLFGDLVVYFWRPFWRPRCVFLEAFSETLLCISGGLLNVEHLCAGSRLRFAPLHYGGNLRGGSRLVGCCLTFHRLLKAVAVSAEYYYVGMMHQPVYQSGGQAVIAKHRIPI